MALVVPFNRFAVGAGLGFGPIPSFDGSLSGAGQSPVRLALFGRYAVVEGQRFRLGFTAGISSGTESDAAMAGDTRLFWTRDGYRYDLGASGELAAGQRGSASKEAWVISRAPPRARSSR